MDMDIGGRVAGSGLCSEILRGHIVEVVCSGLVLIFIKCQK